MSFCVSLQHMIRIGKIAATHGIQGELVLSHITADKTWLKAGMVLFIELLRGSKIPHFVTACKAVGPKEYHVKLDDIDTQEAGAKLIGKNVYAEAKAIAQIKTPLPLLWLGFSVQDQEKGVLGTVNDVFETGHQWLASMLYEGREVLIPLVKPILIEVNFQTKTLHVSLPEGLLDL